MSANSTSQCRKRYLRARSSAILSRPLPASRVSTLTMPYLRRISSASSLASDEKRGYSSPSSGALSSRPPRIISSMSNSHSSLVGSRSALSSGQNQREHQ